MNNKELLYWAQHGSPITRALALLLLDEKTGGKITQIAKRSRERW